jgi:hypothetical protein
VVADEEDGVEASVEPLHHVERLVPPREVRALAHQLARRDVRHQPVRVVDEDSRRTAVERAGDRRVHLAEKQ